MRALKTAKDRGYRVCTNTAIFKSSDVHDLHQLFEHLTDLGVEGIMLSAGYPYQSITDQDIFLESQQSIETFRKTLDPSKGFNFYNNPLYLEFLRGERRPSCSAWTNPTYTPLGWRKPCYLIADQHTDHLDELMQPELWDAYGHANDPRCVTCTMHSGYEAGILQQALTSPAGFAALANSYRKTILQARNGKNSPSGSAQSSQPVANARQRRPEV
jgi:hopanoid biosynthesis associated radical SAM protein HpnH